MQKDISRILIESVINKTLKDITVSPRRTARNLIDMGVNFSKGRFQKLFLSSAQEFLQNQNSAYYDLITDVSDHVDKKIISTFGMNLGYNGCTRGAKKIREIKKNRHFHVAWSLSLALDKEKMEEDCSVYRSIISQGKALGIFVYLLKTEEGQLGMLLPLLEENQDCAFVLFLENTELPQYFLTDIRKIRNTMICVKDSEKAADLCPRLREEHLLYAIYSYYSEENEESIVSGRWLHEMMALHPYFVLLAPFPSCCPETCNRVYEYILSVRNGQKDAVIAMDLLQDSWKINEIISEESCDVGFNADGSVRVHNRNGIEKINMQNIFHSSVEEILKAAVPGRR